MEVTVRPISIFAARRLHLELDAVAGPVAERLGAARHPRQRWARRYGPGTSTHAEPRPAGRDAGLVAARRRRGRARSAAGRRPRVARRDSEERVAEAVEGKRAGGRGAMRPAVGRGGSEPGSRRIRGGGARYG